MPNWLPPSKHCAEHLERNRVRVASFVLVGMIGVILMLSGQPHRLQVITLLQMAAVATWVVERHFAGAERAQMAFSEWVRLLAQSAATSVGLAALMLGMLQTMGAGGLSPLVLVLFPATSVLGLHTILAFARTPVDEAREA